jgi:hypothetical protein
MTVASMTVGSDCSSSCRCIRGEMPLVIGGTKAPDDDMM